MKIATIASAQIPSTRANSIQVMKVCQALKQNGEEPRLYVPGRKHQPWESLKRQYGLQSEFEIHWVPAWRPLRYVDFVLRALLSAKSWQAELVYTRMLQVARTAARMGFPVILELHDLPSGRYGLAHLRKFLHAPTRKQVVLITRSLQALVEAQLGEAIPGDVSIIAPDGVDLERYADLPDPVDARKALHLPERFTALYSGSFYQGRGMQMLFDLAVHFKEMTFLWVGGKPCEINEWREKIQTAHLDNVILPGFVDNAALPEYQAAADLLLMPYSQTVAGSSGGNIASVTSPMKLFEYMACGRAILTSDLPVLHEVLNEGNAVFCPPDDLVGWLDAIQSLAADAPRRERLAAQALKDIRQYSWRRRMEKIIKPWKTSDKKVDHG